MPRLCTNCQNFNIQAFRTTTAPTSRLKLLGERLWGSAFSSTTHTSADSVDGKPVNPEYDSQQTHLQRVQLKRLKIGKALGCKFCLLLHDSVSEPGTQKRDRIKNPYVYLRARTTPSGARLNSEGPLQILYFETFIDHPALSRNDYDSKIHIFAEESMYNYLETQFEKLTDNNNCRQSCCKER